MVTTTHSEMPHFAAKLKHKGELRRVRLPRDATWADFEQAARQLFPSLRATKELHDAVTYRDDSGDEITLSTTEELREALRTQEQLRPGSALTFTIAADDLSDRDSSSISEWLSGALLEVVPPEELAASPAAVPAVDLEEEGDNDDMEVVDPIAHATGLHFGTRFGTRHDGSILVLCFKF